MPRKRHAKKQENTINIKCRNQPEKNKDTQFKDVEENSHLNLANYFTDEKIEEIKIIMKSMYYVNCAPIFGAVALNDIETCKEILQKAGNEVINIKDQNEVTPLLLATKCCKLSTVEFLLSRGADPWAQDSEGENSIMNFINNKDVCEVDFLSVWKLVKNVTAGKLNYFGKTGTSVLHLVLKRQWKKVLNVLLKIKHIDVNIQNQKGITPLMMACVRNDIILVDKLMDAGASPLQEDNKYCTALCYTIAMIQKKNVEMPHLCINSILLFTDETQKINYIKGRLNLVVNGSSENELLMRTINTIVPSIINYFVRHIDDGLKILLDENIFEVLYMAMQKHVEKPDHLQAIMQILIEILKIPDSFLEKNQPFEVLNKFLYCGGLDSCFFLLENDGHNDEKIFKDIFKILLFVCSGSDHFLNFLHKHFDKVKYHYLNSDKNFYEDDSILRESIIFRNKLDLFEDLLRNIFLINQEINSVGDFAGEESILQDCSLGIVSQTDEYITVYSIEDHEKAYEEKYETKPPLEAKLHSKRMKRRSRALKAKITKIKNAELTDRLLNSGQMLGKQKSNASIKEEDTADETPMFLPERKTSYNIMKLLEHEKCLFSAEALNLKKPWIRKDAHKISKDPESRREDGLSKIQFPLSNESYWLKPEWQEKLKVSDLELPINAIKSFNSMCCNSQSHENPTYNFMLDWFDKESLLDLSALTNECDDINMENDSYKDSSVSFLKQIFQKIVDFYQNKWQMDREEEYPHLIHGEYLPYDERRFEKLKSILPQLEQEYIEKLKISYNNLLEAMKNCSETDSIKYKRIVRTVEKLFLRHELRNQPAYPRAAGIRSTILSECSANSNSHENEIQIVIDTPRELPKKISQDELYLREMMSIPHRNVHFGPDEQNMDSVFQDQMQSYHLVQSMVNVCESDEETQKVNNWIKLDKKNSVVKHKERTSIESNATSTSNMWDESKIQKIWTTPPPPGFSSMMVYNNRTAGDKYPVYRSRWCSVVSDMKTSTEMISYMNGEFRVSCKCLMDIISTEGNFGDIHLGFDYNTRPLAVKKIPKQNMDTCKRLAAAVSSVLNLRHQNILHYYICDFDEKDLLLATPLCEYNMGEYLMLTKFSENAHVATFDIVKQFLAGLDYLHERGVVHGNMKPSNIFIDLTGIVKIAEFGIHKALFQFVQPPNSSLIWFSRETYDIFKEINSIECTKSSDVQVAGMLLHFLLTSGRHPFGEQAEEILSNLLHGKSILRTKDVILNDLLSWMLLYDSTDRPSVDQVLKHVYFWNQDRKWKFLLACAGIGTYGTPLSINTEQLHSMFETMARKERIKGEWVSVCKDRFPAYNFTGNHSDTPVGLLKFLQEVVQLDYCSSADLKAFFLEKFPALPLSLYRMLDMTKWMEHPMFKPFTDLKSVIV